MYIPVKIVAGSFLRTSSADLYFFAGIDIDVFVPDVIQHVTGSRLGSEFVFLLVLVAREDERFAAAELVEPFRLSFARALVSGLRPQADVRFDHLHRLAHRARPFEVVARPPEDITHIRVRQLQVDAQRVAEESPHRRQHAPEHSRRHVALGHFGQILVAGHRLAAVLGQQLSSAPGIPHGVEHPPVELVGPLLAE